MSIYTTYSAYPHTIVLWIYMSIYTTYSVVPSYHHTMDICRYIQHTVRTLVPSYHGYIQHIASYPRTIVLWIYMLIYTTYSVIPSYHHTMDIYVDIYNIQCVPSYHGYICRYMQHIASYPRTMDIYVDIYNIQRIP